MCLYANNNNYYNNNNFCRQTPQRSTEEENVILMIRTFVRRVRVKYSNRVNRRRRRGRTRDNLEKSYTRSYLVFINTGNKYRDKSYGN